MAHEVSVNLHQKIVLSKDVEVEVKADGAKLGTILISKGNIEWVPAGNSANKHRLSWKKFAELMENEGRPKRMK
ncbi:hypothetical protein DFO61_0473 [Ectopseudomonas oleovorans]|uniref:Uncharacterized protein n=2 Tax=Pseudomonadaceae TaxID=135621 RepID=A0A397NLA8_ECTOL|nr:MULTISPECIES: hypothetical protein [Pseudomonas]QMV61054.1 hypothetical protein HS968_13430 [Pseudomonas berkeleyensis]RIA36017.1 hypothetical protein DFO61_0473 [Pseudomonas oleovorans]WSO36479.1 hypothetical protein VUJ49_13485 [Pseudomonas berkeleyensis]